jgi:hypothetical protein
VNRLLCFFFAIASVLPASAAESTSKLSALIKETQKTRSDADIFVLAWWIPYQLMKPIFANMMGQFGQNTIFVVFPGKGSDGDKLIDPYKEGQLSFVENGHSFSWRLPLGSLRPDETCPKCGEVLPGNYKFCPYDGTKLESVPVPASSPGS